MTTFLKSLRSRFAAVIPAILLPLALAFASGVAAAAPPTLTTGPATWDTSSIVTLTGTVNPNGSATTALFEYGPTTAYGSTATAYLWPDNGSTALSVSANLGTLPAATTYHYRLTATNAGGTTSGVDRTFVTERVSGDYKYFTADTTATITGYTGAGGAITLPDTLNGLTVTGIGANAYLYFWGLTSVTIPYSVTSIGDRAFGCSGLMAITVDPLNPAYNSQDGVLFDKTLTMLLQFPGGKAGSYPIPNGVTSIGDFAFYGSTGLTSVTILNSVTSIGYYAFSSCSGLTSVTIPNSVTSIGYYAFSSCSGLTAISVDELNSAYSSQDGVLFDKTLTKLLQFPGGRYGPYTIPDSVTRIGDYAFYVCSGLTSVMIGKSVTSIGWDAFSGCSGLTAISVDGLNSAYSSLDGVLFNKSQTTLIQFPAGKAGTCTIPNGVTSIGDFAFSGCTGLTAISVDGQNATYSSQGGVLLNKSQTMLILCPEGKAGSYPIPNGVTSIGDSAFSRCSGLTSITIPSSVTSIGMGAFQGCRGLTSVTIPSSVTSIEANTFGHCYGLTSVTIPNGVTSIGWCAFWNCYGLTSVTIPASVTSISWGAFSYCYGLSSAIFLGNAPSIDQAGFDSTASGFTVYYLNGAVGFTSPPWLGYPSVVAPPEAEITLEEPAGTGLADGGAGDFDTVVMGGTASRVFTIRNMGANALSGLAITKDGAQASDFTVGTLGATTLAFGASTTFTVTFAPGAIGSRSAALHIASNDADENPFDIPISGTGITLSQQLADAINLPAAAITCGGTAP